MSSGGRPIGWIVLTGALLAAVIGLAEACLSAVADVLEELYSSDGGPRALEVAADQLEKTAEDCAPAG